MSVDTVNYALSDVRRRVLLNPENFSTGGQRKLLSMCDVMRQYLMQEDVASFNKYVNEVLAREPDATDFLLEDLFCELGFPNGMREDLDAALAAP